MSDFDRQLAEMRREIRELRSRLASHRDATVTAVDVDAVTFTADVDGAGEVAGIASSTERLPEVGDRVRLLMDGAAPTYQPGVQEIRIRSTTTSGEPYELTELGKTEGGVDPATGEQTWAITTGGVASFQGMSVNEDPVIMGTPFSEYFTESAGGFHAGAAIGSHTDPALTPSGGGETGFFEMAVELQAETLYRIHTPNIWVRPVDNTASRIDLNMRYTVSINPSVDPPAVSATSNLFTRWAQQQPQNGTIGNGAILSRLYRPPTYQHLRLLLSLSSTGGQAYIEMGSANFTDSVTGIAMQPEAAAIYVEELGGLPWTNRAVLNGGSSGGSGAAPKKKYTYDYYPLWTRRFRGDGGVHTDSGDAYQGQTPHYTANGNQATQIGDFRRNGTGPSIASDLAGATIEACHFGLYAKHWHANAGGTGVLRYHNNTSAGSLNNYAGQWLVGGWKPGSFRWTNVGVAVGNGLRDSTIKGIQVGPAPSTSTEYYGYFGGHAASTSYRPRIRVTFTK